MMSDMYWYRISKGELYLQKSSRIEKCAFEKISTLISFNSLYVDSTSMSIFKKMVKQLQYKYFWTLVA